MSQNDKKVKRPLLRVRTSIRGQYGITMFHLVSLILCVSLDGSK